MKIKNNNRITVKWYDDNPPNKSGYVYNDIDDENRNHSSLKKLGQFEDIEEEFGIDLATVSKAIKGIEHRCVYNVEEKCDVFVNTIIFYGNDLIIKGYAENSVFLVKDCGKTWALTKEELL